MAPAQAKTRRTRCNYRTAAMTALPGPSFEQA